MKKFALVLFSLMLFAAVAFAADIELKPVKSSFLDNAGYDAEAKVLAIQMKNSSDVYYYQDVPASIYEGLLEADSKGAYYVAKVKGQFKTDKAE